jgi:cell wall-associated NlpC family hydrolase
MRDSAGQIDTMLQKYGSPLAGLGHVFVAAGKKYGVDPRLVVAISGIESSFGKHTLGAHNAWGWGPGIPFGSWHQAITTVTRGLKTGYLNEGRTSPDTIVSKWAPASDGNNEGHWSSTVKQFMRELGATVPDVTVAAPTAPATKATKATKVLSAVPIGPTRADLVRQAAFTNLSEIAAHGRIDPAEMLANVSSALSAVPVAQQKSSRPATRPTGNVGTRTLAAAHATRTLAATHAAHFIGTPYLWGGTTPKGFDCSGLIQYVYAKQGVALPRTSYDQFKVGQHVAKSQLQPGDIVFFWGSDPKNGLPGHEGLYMGNGKMIEAPHTGARVRVSSVNRSDFAGARRVA